MALQDEIKNARKKVVKDGYDMSVGELLSIYKDDELIISPDFQRYFRWDNTQKSRFIESLLLGIPIPPIFVFATKTGDWELIDGLQRLSTIFEFVGALKDKNGTLYPPSTLNGTKLLPSLEGKKWELESNGGNEPDSREDETRTLGTTLRLEFKRARIRVEILKNESDPKAKFELFQRLNTGGSTLSAQEIRNCVITMVNKGFYKWLRARAKCANFLATIALTHTATRQQKHLELILRFIVFRNKPYVPGLDVHEYLDSAMLEIAIEKQINLAAEKVTFESTFQILNSAMGVDAFKRFDGTRFLGSFNISAFDVIALGLSKNLATVSAMREDDRNGFVKSKIEQLWQDVTFTSNSGAGVRGTTRLSNLLPLAEGYFQS